MRTRLIVVGPLPPPYHGVSISTRLVLAGRALNRRFAVEHFDTSDHRTGTNVGKWEIRNAALAALALGRFARALRGTPGIVYLPISQGLPGLTRDALLVIIAARLGWRVALHLRGSELADVFRAQSTIVRRALARAFARVDAAAVLGESVRASLDGVIDPSRVSVVPNGTPDPGGRGWPAEPLTVLALSNYSERKGVLEAMDGALAATREEPSIRVVFAGDSSEPAVAARLRHLASQSEGRVVVRDPLLGSEKRRMLQSSAMLLFVPREPEGQPRVVLEAMAAGLPVITTDRGTIAETLGPGASKLVLDQPYPAQICQLILRIARDPDLRERISRSNRERFERHFTLAAADRALTAWLATLDGQDDAVAATPELAGSGAST